MKLSKRSVGGAVALLIALITFLTPGFDQTSPQAAAQALAPGYLSGVDVASYQGYPNWTLVKGTGRTFVFNKATEGTGYVNPYYATNKTWIKQAGFYHVAYHFGHPGL